MSLIHLINIASEQNTVQVFLSRPLTSEEQAEINKIVGHAVDLDGDGYPIGHDLFREWINVDVLTPQLEAYLQSLS